MLLVLYYDDISYSKTCVMLRCTMREAKNEEQIHHQFMGQKLWNVNNLQVKNNGRSFM